ncbi:MAG: hypothetical protein KAG53_05385 [Endozoicomonadaceae bacterium]|nr:hypothetical protein [Endozoicomonadaceae bacterium]
MDISKTSIKESINTETDDSIDKTDKKDAVKFVNVESKFPSAEGGACYLSDSERSLEIVDTPTIILDNSINLKAERLLFGRYDILECRQEDFVAATLKLEEFMGQSRETIEKKHKWLMLMSERFMLGHRLELMGETESSFLNNKILELCDEIDIYVKYISMDEPDCILQLLLRSPSEITKKTLDQFKKSNKKSYSFLENYVSNRRAYFEHRAKTKMPYSQECKMISKFLIKSKLVEVIRHKDEKLYHDLKKNDLIFLSENDNYLSKYDQKILACYELYRLGSNSRVNSDNIDLQNIPLLEDFIYTLKKEFEHNLFSQHQVESICFLWMTVLAKYLTEITDVLFHKQHNVCDILKYDTPDSSKIKQEGISCCHDRCIKMMQWAVSNGLHWIIDSRTAKKIYFTLCSDMKKNNKLINIFLKIVIDKSNNERDVTTARMMIIYVSELIDSEEDFRNCLEASSKHTALPLLIILWDDFGFFIQSHHRPLKSSTLINPERAISCLIELKQNSEQLDKIKHEMLFIYDYYKRSHYITRSPANLEWRGRIALYFFLIADWEKGRFILEATNFNCPYFYHALCSIASEEFKLALIFLDKIEKETNFHNHLKYIVDPLKGILMKKIAEKMNDDNSEKNINFEIAIRHLTEVAATRKEFLKPISHIQEQLGRYNDAYNSLAILETKLKIFKKSSAENCLLNSVQEHMKRLAESHPECLNKILEFEVSKEQKEQKTNKSNKGSNKNTVSDSKLHIKSVDKTSSTLPAASLNSDGSISLDTSRLEMNQSESVNTVMLEEIKTKNCSETEEKHDKELCSIVDYKTVPYRQSLTCLTYDVVEHAMHETRNDRYKLTGELLLSVNINYTALLNKHDDLIKQYTNPVVKMVIIQNKAWSLRDKSFNSYALTLESNRKKDSIENLKKEIRQSILCMMYSSIEKITDLWQVNGLPNGWKNNPDLIISQELNEVFKYASPRVKRQICGHLSTVAHIMKDIVYDQPKNNKDKQAMQKSYGKPFHLFLELSEKYYSTRNTIDITHSTNNG